jgi:hypothetical protein
MNFKDWKKVCEDGKSCTLVHPKGHTMTIAMRSLPSIHREQIKRLAFAEGGDVLDSGEGGTSEQGKDVRAARRLKSADLPDSIIKKSSDGFNRMAKDEARGRAEMGRTVKPNLKGLAKGGKVQYYDEGTPDDTVQDSGDTVPGPGDTTHNGSPITINVGTGSPPQMASSKAPQPAQPVAAPAQPAPQSNVPPAPNLLYPDNTVNAPAAVRELQNAEQGTAQVEGNKARAAAVAEQQRIDAGQDLAKYNANTINELAGHVGDSVDAIQKGMINEKHFLQSQSTTQKWLNAIGLATGAASVPFGGQNFAMDFLNKQIDRDIEAQKSRSDQQKTILGAWQHLYGDQVVAQNMAKVTENELLAHRISLAAAQNGTAQAQFNAQRIGAEKTLQNKQIMEDTAGRLRTLRTSPFPVPRTGAPQQGQPGAAPGANGPPGAQRGPPGSPGAPSAANGAQTQQPSIPTYPILAPDAESKLDGVRYHPKLKENYDQISQQYTQARQAEKVLNGPNNDGVGGIHDLFQQMKKANENTGVYGHVHRQAADALSQIPVIGGAAGAATNVIPLTKSEKQFNGLKGTIETDLATALNGLMTPTDIHKLVENNSPAYLDDDQDVSRKENNFVNIVHKAVKTSLLSDARMLRKKK